MTRACRMLVVRFAALALIAAPLSVAGGCEVELGLGTDPDEVDDGTTGGVGGSSSGGETPTDMEDAGEPAPEDAGPQGDAGEPAPEDAGPQEDAGEPAPEDAGLQEDAGEPAPEDASTQEDAGPTERDPCGGLRGLACGDDEYCDYAAAGSRDCGFADGMGVCLVKPQACTLEFDPVCGCDGKTYGNACGAHAAGVSVAEQGECDAEPSPGEECGPVTCGAGLECCNALCGICTPPGMSCVQGCPDPGPGSGATCGGIAALQCEAGEFCNYEPPRGQGCDGTIADAAGACETQPQACTREYRPVCGCDTTTYGNRCEAHAAGMSVKHEGACTVTECEAIGGRALYSNGASIPECEPGEEDHGAFVGPNGEMPIEPTRCCVPL